jgi:pyrroloquinoline quinone biosynthesis protein B
MVKLARSVVGCFVLLVTLAGVGGSRQPEPAAGWRLVVLGTAQDGGMPHLGCLQPPCSEVRAGRRPAAKVSCLGLVNAGLGLSYLFDATPDLPAQVHALTGGTLPDAIFLTHGHIGHYTGLMYLGKEARAARGIPVYGTRRMAGYLGANGPWSLLVKDGHIELRLVRPDEAVRLAGGIRVTAIQVAHRDEFTDTVGYVIEGPRQKAVFIPDTDRWEKGSVDIRTLVSRVDLAFLDGTFSSPQEIGGRDVSAIPHPMIPATRELLQGVRARIYFIHLNHTNPEWRGGKDIAREGTAFDF